MTTDITLAANALRVAVLQFNPIVGDLAGNARQIVDQARLAHAQGARLVLTPELSLCGYPPEDLLLRPSFIQACQDALIGIAAELADLPDLHVLVGHPAHAGGPGARSRSWSTPDLLNAASHLTQGAVHGTYAKRELPNYQVFDERRYFVSGRDAGFGPLVIDVAGVRLGVLICEDAWFAEPAQATCAQGAQVLLVINASPFHAGKAAEREARMAERARQHQCPLIYAHMVGGQDEVVFDGASFALDAQGQLQARAAGFEP